MNILIYQMGKVGSSSVIWSLKSIGMDADRAGSWNIHDIELKSLQKSKDYYDKIITMVRDPIRRNIAQLFTSWEEHLGYFPEEYDSSMVETFKNEFPHDAPLQWFDQWMLTEFGIDVYREPFPKEVGWKIYDDRLLVIRTEDMTSVIRKALRTFIHIHKLMVINVQHRNQGEVSRGEFHGQAYMYFKRYARFSESFLDHMYESKYVQHFYTEGEIAGFRTRWAE